MTDLDHAKDVSTMTITKAFYGRMVNPNRFIIYKTPGISVAVFDKGFTPKIDIEFEKGNLSITISNELFWVPILVAILFIPLALYFLVQGFSEKGDVLYRSVGVAFFLMPILVFSLNRLTFLSTIDIVKSRLGDSK